MPSGRSRSREASDSRWKRSPRRCRALRESGGASRSRAEVNGILVVDDFAHHPTAVAGTLAAARARWPGRRLWALFEPRSNTAGRKIFEEDYARAFGGADALVLAPVFHARRLTPETVLDRASLARRFAGEGKPAFAPDSISEIPEFLRRNARSGDVLILMSSGAFGGLPGDAPGRFVRPLQDGFDSPL